MPCFLTNLKVLGYLKNIFESAYKYNTALPVVKEEGGFLLKIISYNN
jgi:hypothetical protein